MYFALITKTANSVVSLEKVSIFPPIVILEYSTIYSLLRHKLTLSERKCYDSGWEKLTS